MSRHTFDACLTYGDNGEREFSLTAEYAYSPAYNGRGETPDEPAHVEVHRVTGRRWEHDKARDRHVEVGPVIDFTELVDLETLARELVAEHEGQIEHAREQAAEARAEDRRLAHL